eukprot:3572038-Alexandrium_andersonii.AAC.1
MRRHARASGAGSVGTALATSRWNRQCRPFARERRQCRPLPTSKTYHMQKGSQEGLLSLIHI